jgi:hypothetical protein
VSKSTDPANPLDINKEEQIAKVMAATPKYGIEMLPQGGD